VGHIRSTAGDLEDAIQIQEDGVPPSADPVFKALNGGGTQDKKISKGHLLSREHGSNRTVTPRNRQWLPGVVEVLETFWGFPSSLGGGGLEDATGVPRS